MTEGRHIDDLAELRRLVAIEDIIFYEVHGRRRDGFKDAPEVVQGTNVMQLAEAERVRMRFRTVVRAPDGEYVVDLATVFKLHEPVEIDPEVMRIFAGTVAFPIAHPFIRETLRDIATRLGLKRPTLQLLPPEGIELDDPETQQIADR